ncbi:MULTISPECIES: TetR/AcrR family transcriptional regulator [unclassified Curtobacterium]|uniref:TetR/AcrR family transcriptional regulator n=1 Tax=unclassified Curtobacterium TaxID=257496 RepID=UPI00226AFED6|nr:MULTISPECIES: TetR/AcrR family transcriptional regulator [unclassified Curtobacterium]
MSTPYHHGSLREVLVTEGRQLLMEEGAQAVTIRGLAKRAGVSHSAPLRHFPDRDALLDAIAAEGFDELTAALGAADRHEDLHARLSEYAHAHVRFAAENGRLMELMFTGGPREASSPASQAATRFFAQGAAMLGEHGHGRPGPLPFLVAGMLEGISALASTGRLAADQVDEVTDAAVALLLPAVRGQLDQR